MDIPTLVAALGACQSPDPAVRKAAEDALNQVRRRAPHPRKRGHGMLPQPPLAAATTRRCRAALLLPADTPLWPSAPPGCSTSMRGATLSTCCAWRWRRGLTRRHARWHPSHSKIWSNGTGRAKVRCGRDSGAAAAGAETAGSGAGMPAPLWALLRRPRPLRLSSAADGKPGPLAPEDKEAVRGMMLEGVTRAPHAVWVQVRG